MEHYFPRNFGPSSQAALAQRARRAAPRDQRRESAQAGRPAHQRPDRRGQTALPAPRACLSLGPSPLARRPPFAIQARAPSHNKTTGREVHTPKVDLWHFENGRATRFSEYYDTLGLATAADSAERV